MILIGLIVVACLAFVLGLSVGKSGERAALAEQMATLTEVEASLAARERAVTLAERKKIGAGRQYLSEQ